MTALEFPIALMLLMLLVGTASVYIPPSLCLVSKPMYLVTGVLPLWFVLAMLTDCLEIGQMFLPETVTAAAGGYGYPWGNSDNACVSTQHSV